jgi:hypothetical protein
MATGGSNVVAETYAAAGDLSTKQFYFMKNSSTTARTCTVVTGVTDKPVGVLMNKPAAAGRAAAVATRGRVNVVAGGTVAAGDSIGSHSDGTCVTYAQGTDTTKYIMGICVVGGASGEIITIDLAGPAIARGA